LQKYNDTLVNNYNQIYNENKRLQEEITNKNTEITEITELLKGKAAETAEAAEAADENIEG
jgi:cell division septum initiation protein DivIVA